MHSSSCAAAACGTGFSVATAWAAASGGKDHRDAFDQGGSGGIESAAARAAALRSAYPGMQGFLATRTSGAEQRLLLQLSADGWLGGSDEAGEGAWCWSDGPESGGLATMLAGLLSLGLHRCRPAWARVVPARQALTIANWRVAA